MTKNKQTKNNSGTLSSELIQRIDKMNEDETFNPYKSIRKNIIDNRELFKEDDYILKDDDVITRNTEDTNKKRIKKDIFNTVLGTMLVVVVAGLAYLVYSSGIRF